MHRCSRSLRKASASSPSKSSDSSPHRFIPVDNLTQRQPWGSNVQPENLLYAPGGPYTQLLSSSRVLWPVGSHALHFASEDDIGLEKEGRSEQARRKKQRQWSKWADVIIPSLVVPYLRLLRETDSLRLPCPVISSCQCGESVRELSIACVFFQSESHND